MEWFRVYHGISSDDKWPLIARKSGQPIAYVVAVWVSLLECASQADDCGSIERFDPESVDAQFQMPDGATQSIIDALSSGTRPRIIDGYIANWSKRQPRRERDDDSTERVREYRKRQKESKNTEKVTGNANETPCNANVTPAQHHETPREEESRVDKSREEIKEKDIGTASKAKRFTPPTLQEVSAYCIERGGVVDPQRWFDHYTANGWRVGKNPMKDWRAAVRTWEEGGKAKKVGNGQSGQFEAKDYGKSGRL